MNSRFFPLQGKLESNVDCNRFIDDILPEALRKVIDRWWHLKIHVRLV